LNTFAIAGCVREEDWRSRRRTGGVGGGAVEEC